MQDSAGLPHNSTPLPPAKQPQRQHICSHTQAAATTAAAAVAAPHCWRVTSRWQPRPLLLLLLLASAASVLRLPVPAGAQQDMPFQGQGDVPPAVPVDVYVSPYVDRLLAVDDRHYEFTAVVWFYLSWTDARVRGIIAANAEKLANETANYKCDKPCQSNNKVDAGGCCDGVWQPYIAFSNLKYLPQDRVVRYGFGFDPNSDSVFQWRSVHAVYYTPMDLRAFPFDAQQLLIQMEVPQARSGWSGGLVNLIPSTTGASLFTAKTRGDDVSGWGVADVRLTPFTYPLCEATLSGALGPSAPTDPMPVMPEYMWEWKDTARYGGGDAGSCAAVLLANPRKAIHSPFWRNPLTNASTVKAIPIPVSGLNCVILVRRFTVRWILSAIFPIMATTWLGFLVFFLPRDDMNGRLGSIVALFLALAAIQFVVDQDVPASSYITPLQQLTLASYLSLILVGLECVIIWWLTTYHAEKVRMRRHLEAQRNFNLKLGAVKAALDAWLAKAQAGHRGASASSPSRSRSTRLWGSKKLAESPVKDGAAAAAGASDGAGGASDTAPAPDAPPRNGAASPTAAAGSLPPHQGEGEVRLLVQGDGGAPAAAATPAAAPRPAAAAGPGSPAEAASMAFAAAAAQAALAAAELAATEGGASPTHHRTGLLRFMRQREDSDGAAGAAAATPPSWPINDNGLAASEQQQPAAAGPQLHQAAAAAAARPSDTHNGGRQPGSGSGGGMSQLVTDLLAAQGKELPTTSRQQGAASGGGAGGDSAAAQPASGCCGCLARRCQPLHLFLDSVVSDDAFADRVAHVCNKWCAISQLVMYNVAVILIFVVNSRLYRVD